MFSLEEVFNAYLRCKKGKKSSNLYEFEMNLEKNILKLHAELCSSSYSISSSNVFVLTYPKIREIWAVDIKDRIVHHLEQFYESSSLFNFKHCFLESSYACRVSKGTHKAFLKAKQLYNSHTYVLKLDISSFFVSIHKETLFSIIEEDFKSSKIPIRKDILELLMYIIFHSYTKKYTATKNSHLLKEIPLYKSLVFAEKKGCGLPIGNLSSQFFANVYLNKLDYFITQYLGFSSYIRYMDDFLIFSNSKLELEHSIEKINSFLKSTLHLHLAKEKIQLVKTTAYLDFVGYIIHRDYTLVRKISVKECKRKIYGLTHKTPFLDVQTQIQVQSVVNSYFGHFTYANSYRLVQSIYEKMKLDSYFTISKNNTDDKKIGNANGHGGELKSQEATSSLSIQRKVKQEKFSSFSQQYDYFKHKYPNYLRIIQMGHFYRVFESQAVLLQQEVGLKLFIFKRMLCCGFSIRNAHYLEKIKQLGYNYVIVIEKDRLANGLKERVEYLVNEEGHTCNTSFNTQHIIDSLQKQPQETTVITQVMSIIERLEELSPKEVYFKLYELKKKL